MPTRKPEILVLGASGQLGRSFAKISSEYPQWDFHFPEEGIADITDPKAMAGLLHRRRPQEVINCAAYTAVERAEDDPEAAMRVNAEGPGFLGRLCEAAGIALVHYSTDYIFDGNSDEPYSEDSPPNPLNVYGKSKLEGEKAVVAAGGNAVIIRTSWVYSEFGNNFVSTMLRLAKEGSPLKVVDDQRGTPTYATDLARATMYILSRGIAGCSVLNYTALGDTTWYGFAREIFRRTGTMADLSPVRTGEYAAKAMRPANGTLSMSKALGLGVPLRPWQEALEDCLGEMGLLKTDI